MSEEEAYAKPLGSPADKLVFVVDDDPLIRDLLDITLKDAGFKTAFAVNGHDAAGKLETLEPHLIITDLMMPGQGGYEFLRSLQGSAGGRLPIIVITASQLDASTVRMIKQEANVVEFVNKPIKMALLIGALHKHLNTAPLPTTSRGLNDR
ncbi:MAG: response regulator [Elusimicrobiota bacterium]|nr:response regulator [Elusimicrobiota bacterium]